MTAAADPPYNPAEHVIQQLRQHGSTVEGRVGNWTAQCPAHEDRTPSLSIGIGQDGKALINCHAGCNTGDILTALQLEPRQLFPDWQPHPPAVTPVLHHVRAWRTQPEPPPKPPSNTRREKTNHWDYHHPDGTPAARIVRYNVIDKDTGEIIGKTFTQHAADGNGGWLPNLAGRTIPLYNAPAVAAAITNHHPIIITEGEKDADTAIHLGFTGTTNPQGANSWRPNHTAQLAGADTIIIVADNDPPGIAHATTVATDLAEGIGVTAKIVLPRVGKDLADHVAAGYGVGDLILHDEAVEAERVNQETRTNFPALDWHTLWADDSEEEWILEPLIPARRLIALYSAPKVGKSLLMLELAVGIATGGNVLGTTPDRPRRVLYIDLENDPKADIRARLQAMGHGPDDLHRLIYLSYPTLSALDSPKGAAQLMGAVTAYECEVVVIDTVSRVIKGEENENDTWLNFYRNTGLALKQAGVALIRLDHSGKDETKGQRGGSAKMGDVDAVWRLTKVADAVLQLTCELTRLPIMEKILVLHRHTNPLLRHIVDANGAGAAWKAKVDDLIEWLDTNGIPDTASVATVDEEMKKRGRRGSRELRSHVVKVRKARVPEWEQDGLNDDR